MDAEVGIFHELGGSPLAGFGGVVGFNMAGDWRVGLESVADLGIQKPMYPGADSNS